MLLYLFLMRMFKKAKDQIKEWLYKKHRDFWFFGYYRQLFYFFKYRKFKGKLNLILIYCDGRTGSSVLCEGLAGSERISYDEEIFRKGILHFQSFICGHTMRKPDNWYVLKIKPMHLERMQLKFDDLMRFMDFHNTFKIHLYRELSINRALSSILARERNLYYTHHKLSMPAIALNAHELVKKYYESRKSLDIQKQDVANRDFVAVSYEKHILNSPDFKQLLSDIYAKLRIESAVILPKMQKVVGKDLSKEIRNWPEIQQALQKEGITIEN